MSSIDAKQLAERIDTVLNILVAGDYSSAINNLEILKKELLSQAADRSDGAQSHPAPWEV